MVRIGLSLVAAAIAVSSTPAGRFHPPLPTAPVRLILAAEGNEARYRVREQLAGVDFPSDAVGATRSITGALSLDPSGKVVSAESRFMVDLATLKSDRDRRDRFIQRRTLETDQFPKAELEVTEIRGLPWPLPATGKLSLELVGNLTVHGITHATTWQVSADAADGGFSGTAATRFTFGDFGMTRPLVGMVLSVEDDVRLEYDFRLVPAPAGP
jgi:polyisoprenoid-binding protein YceI